MAHRKLKLMISSRCKTKFPFDDKDAVPLSDIRRDLKKEIEKEKYLGKPLFAVWINETETEDASLSSWEACIKQSSDCDAFISILDGHAGWQVDEESRSGIGICHAEFETAYTNSPGKVRVVSLAKDGKKLKSKDKADMNFIRAVQKADLFETLNISSIEDLKKNIKYITREIILQLAHEGAREFKKSGSNSGQALDWSRMNFSERQNSMVGVLIGSFPIQEKPGPSEDTAIVKVAGKSVFFKCSAIPAAFTVSAAREMVGQPFLKDHLLHEEMKGTGSGPVHVIACQKNVTETQAMGLLGFPDATIVSGAFGIYVADNVQKIQLCFISHCRDSASTKHGLHKLFEWLLRTGEDKHLAKRAVSRSKILKTIAAELS